MIRRTSEGGSVVSPAAPQRAFLGYADKARDRRTPAELAELLLRLADGQVKEITWPPRMWNG